MRLLTQQKIILFLFIFLHALSHKAQCTFGNFPPPYTQTVNTSADHFVGSKYYLANPMYLTGLGYKGEGSGTGIQMAIYEHYNNLPGNLVAYTSTAAVSPGNHVLNVITPTLIPAGYYWILSNFQTSAPVISFNPGGVTLYAMAYSSFGAAPPSSTATVWSLGSNFDGNYWAVSSVAVPPSTFVCTGQTYTLQSAGASSYSWSTGATGPTLAVSPSVTTIYTLTTPGNSSCNAAAVTVSVFPYPVVTVSPLSSTFCFGETFTASASGANSYLWSYSGINTSTASIFSYYSQTYSVTGTTNGCSHTATLAVTVNTVPTLFTTGQNYACIGAVTTLTASGADSYTWVPSGVTGSINTFTPSTNIVYTLSGASMNGCEKQLTGTIVAGQLPTLSIAGPDSICFGNTAVLNASGAFSYTWSTAQNSSSIQLSPQSTSVYTLEGLFQNSTCKSSITRTLTVNALPSVSVSGSNVICFGDGTILTASGANTYTWTTGATSPSLLVSPVSNTVYTVIGGDQNGCHTSVTKSISVNPLPTFTISGGSFVCKGAYVSQLASGSATSYNWSDGSVGNLVSLSPTVSTVYSVTGTDANNCSSTLTKSITVNPLPTVLAHASAGQVCSGNSAILYASGANAYFWSGGITNNVAFYPVTSATYTVTGTDANSCQNTATVSLNVLNNPLISASVSRSVICLGESATITASGASTYTWNGNVSGSVIVETPTVVGMSTHLISGTDLNGCSSNTQLFSFFVVICDGVEEEAHSEHNISIYPNPTKGEFSMELNTISPATAIEVYTSLGELVLKCTPASLIQKVNLQEAAKGIYLILIKEGSQQVKRVKLIKE